MRHDTIFQYRKSTSIECCVRHAGTRLYFAACRPGIDPKIRSVTPTGLPIPSGRARNQWSCLGSFTIYSNHDKNIRGCSDPASDVCAHQRYDHRQNCGAGHHQLSRTARPWLITYGEVMTLNCTMLLTACMPPNWNRYLLFWFQTRDVVLINPLN